jgi:hypothetical protein
VGAEVAPSTRDGESWEVATEVAPLPAVQVTPTEVPGVPPASSEPCVEQATPTEVTGRAEPSEPIRMISMKDRTAAAPPRSDEPRAPLHVQLRSLAQVSSMRPPPGGLGRLAPPLDPDQARRRRHRANAAWACLAIALACGISLAIWLVAGR